MKKILTLIVICLATSLAFAQNENISLKLKKGENYKQATNSNAVITQEVYGQTMEMKMKVFGELNYNVLEVESDKYLLEATYLSLGMNMEMQGTSMSFSSENPQEGDVFSKMLQGILDNPFEVVMLKNGKVEEIRKIDAVIESMLALFPELSETEKVQFKTQMNDAYGSKALKGSIEMVTAIYPDKPVAVGEKWQTETKLNSGGMVLDLLSDYEFVEMADDHALVSGNTKMTTSEETAPISQNGMTMKIVMEGTMASTIKVDKKTGWIIEATINQELTGNTVVEPTEQLPDGFKIPMIMKSEMTITD